ncbi:hypothetical protein ACFL2V_20945, partial [Pseudomonadota bacterium]
MLPKPLSATLTILMLLLVNGMVSQANADTSLGRLFTTVAERASLDRLRNADIIQKPGVGIKKENRVDAPPETAADIVLDGVVIRSNGEKTIWINGQQVKGNRGPDSIRVYRGPDSANRVVVGTPGKRAV